MIKVLLVEDQRLFSEGVKALIERMDDMEVVGMASNGKEAVTLMNQVEADVILMDIHMPHVDGIVTTTHLKDNYPNVKCVLLTTFAEEDLIVAGFIAGADGFLLKSLDAEHLISAVRDAYHDQVVISGKAAKILASKIQGFQYNKKEQLARELKNRNIRLSDREIDIVSLVMKEATNREIAQRLFLSEGTIKNYISIIYTKINLNTRKDVIEYLNGLVHPDY
ncbi:response regulator [Virgibacillus natechei]|nr:response regulator transcription factor [Virgibacillus natechei]UZD12364.1 response regulator transcription factor [Virgibacillus natechei]